MNLTCNFTQLLQDYPGPRGDRFVLCHHHENKHRQQKACVLYDQSKRDKPAERNLVRRILSETAEISSLKKLGRRINFKRLAEIGSCAGEVIF